MTKSVENYNDQLEPNKSDLSKLKQIKWCVGVASGTVDPDAEEKKNGIPAKRPSVLEKLDKYNAMIKATEQKKLPPKSRSIRDDESIRFNICGF